MKKLLFLLMLIPAISFAQVNLGLGVGIKPSINLHIGGETETHSTIGLISQIEADFSIKNDMNGNVDKNLYIDEERHYKSFGGNIGVGVIVLKRYFALAKIGVCQDYKYSAKTHKELDKRLDFLYGAVVGYYITKHIAANIGYDNFNQWNIGLQYRISR